MEVSRRMMIKNSRILILVILMLSVFRMETVVISAVSPLQKVRLKIEGIHEKSRSQKIGSFFCGFTPSTDCDSQNIPLMLQKIKTALISVPGVKTVEIKILKKWFLFKDYNQVYAIVEFELGTLTSETLIIAAESASDQKNIYKIKFIE